MSQQEQDEFHGIGGSYVIDPKTGERKLVARTQEADAVAAEPQPTQEQDNATPQA
nr:hypothetical protein [Dechloromonas sp.]